MRFTFFGSFLALLFTVNVVQAQPPSKEQLMNALLCKGDSLDLIRSAAKSNPSNGELAGTSWGDEMDEIVAVVVKNGIEIAGAKASAVVAQFSAPYDNFRGIVFAEFQGPYEPVIKELRLKPSAVKDEDSLGAFVLPIPSGEKDEVCPPTVILTPLSENRFALGCGWCNG